MPAAIPAPPLYRLYRGAMTALLPAAWRLVSRKLARQDVPETRRREQLGHATQPRPEGDLVWLHGASVGESLAGVALIDALRTARPDLSFLMTSGTATSAEILKQRMPERCRHQFAPLDAAGPVDRFLGHWRPDAGIFLESELWPNMLVMARQAGVPLALVNARLSRKSVDGWRKFPATSAFILDQFDLLVTQNRENADNLRAMGAPPDRLQTGLNLKSTARPLPVDDVEVARLRTAIGARPCWVAASTHKGEEDIVLAAHDTLRKAHPDLLLILAPRHPERRDTVSALIAARQISFATRSAEALPAATDAVYLADTLGELGNWYALSDIVFLGGSLLPIGGHNPFEVAQAGDAVLSGPFVTNFQETFDQMAKQQAALTVSNADELAGAVDRLLRDGQSLAASKSAALSFAERSADRLSEITERLLVALKLDQP